MAEQMMWGEHPKKKDKGGRIKFPVTLFITEDLVALGEIKEDFELEEPRLKETKFTEVDINKKQPKVKGTKLF